MAALAKPFQLSPDQIEFYQQNRYIKLKQVFDEETITKQSNHSRIKKY